MKKASQKTADRLLSQAGLKKTKPREAVLAILIDHHRPLAIDEIKQLVGPTVNLVTIYRILDKLTAQGLIYQTDLRSGKAYFEYQADHHHHIVCLTCGRTEAIKTCIDDLSTQTLKQAKYFDQISNHTLEFFGYCQSCD